MSEAKRVPENYHSEKADVAALKKHLRYWNKFGWDTASIALGWFLCLGYKRDRAQDLAEAASNSSEVR